MTVPRDADRARILVALGSGTLLNPLNSSMLAVALIRIQHDFGLRFASVTWLISGFYLASAVGHPVMGRLSDLFGARRTFACGLVLAALASGLAPLAPSFWLLVVARIAQAFGTSALFPAAMPIVGGFERGLEGALATLRVVSATVAAIGPALGGLLLAVGDWWTLFLVNLPVVAVSLTLILRRLPPDPAPAPPGGSSRLARMDLPGAGLFGGTLLCALVFLLSLSAPGAAWWSLPVAGACMVLFLRRERQASSPFLDLDAANRALLFTCLQFALVNVVFYAVMFGIPNYLQDARGMSPSASGVVMLSLAGCGVLGTTISAWVVRRGGLARALVLAAAVLGAGAAMLLVEGAGGQIALLVLALALIGFSNGFHNLGLQAVLQRTAPPESLGAASGLFMSSRYVGAILAGALLGLLFTTGSGGAHLEQLALVLLLLTAGIGAVTGALRAP